MAQKMRFNSHFQLSLPMASTVKGLAPIWCCLKVGLHLLKLKWLLLAT